MVWPPDVFFGYIL